MRLVLGSSSRYRREQLTSLGYAFETQRPGIDESPADDETPAELVARLAASKAAAVASRRPDAVVIGADQVCVCDDEILGKPGTRERAVAQLVRLSGREVVFLSAIHVRTRDEGITHIEPTEVSFRTLSEREIANYVDLDNPLDCAGAIRSEGRGPLLFEHVKTADPSAIIGLPLIRLGEILRGFGLNPLA